MENQQEKQQQPTIDLSTYPFPHITAADTVFSTQKTIPELYEEAVRRGFNHDWDPYCKLFSQFFFEGGTPIFKKDASDHLLTKGWLYCVSLMRSFEPKHQEKQAVCAMLMSEILELPEQDNKKP